MANIKYGDSDSIWSQVWEVASLPFTGELVSRSEAEQKIDVLVSEIERYRKAWALIEEISRMDAYEHAFDKVVQRAQGLRDGEL